jgi:Mg2+-importing ATPase
MESDAALAAYWSRAAVDLLAALETSTAGLTPAEAARRLISAGPNSLAGKSETAAWKVFLRQFRSSLVLILIFAAIMSAAVGEMNEAVIIGIIIFASCGLSFLQEYHATRAMDALRQRISQRPR